MAIVDAIKKWPNRNKEEKAEELLKSLLALVSIKSTKKGNVRGAMTMDVDNNHEDIAKFAVGQLQSILGGLNKRRRRGNKGGNDK